MRPSIATVAVALAVLGLVVPAGLGAVAGGVSASGASAQNADGLAAAAAQDDSPCAGRITSPADGLTVVSVQGARFGDEGGKTAARLVAFGPEGEIQWVYHSAERQNIVWSYDVDPLPNGNLFVVGTHPGTTVLTELDRRTGEVVWKQELNFTDTHDADMLDRHRVAIAHMRNYNESAGRNDDRVVVYNRTSREIEWEWYFRDHYSSEVGGNYSEDWTHVNDVDRVGEHYFLLSPRNLDQVVLVNQTSGDIVLRLGEDDRHAILNKQHNPDYLESRDGDPTFLVADSENDRIVEYEWTGDGWRRTWKVGGSRTLSWPRDADRLPNGNTLIGDSRNNRVIEVTPEGEVVWEVYAPWLVYDVERIPGDGSAGPTAADQGTTGSYSLKHADPPDEATLERCDEVISGFSGGWQSTVTSTPQETPTWTDKPDGPDESNLTGGNEGGNVEGVGGPLSPGSVVGIAVVAVVLASAAVLILRRS